METKPILLESKKIIRFQHCDPFNHLNNAEYLNYMVNAREDQVLEHYGLDIYKMGREQGKSWVVGTNQIAYIKPALTMEEVCIQTQLMNFDETSLFVELKMFNSDKTEIKALMWSNYVHFNFIKVRREIHEQKFMDLFQSVVNPVPQLTFEKRIKVFKQKKM